MSHAVIFVIGDYASIQVPYLLPTVLWQFGDPFVMLASRNYFTALHDVFFESAFTKADAPSELCVR